MVSKWLRDHYLGIPELDDEHVFLSELIQKIKLSVENKESQEKLMFLLDEVIQFSEAHFAHEERLMAQAGYPDYEEHKKKHWQLIGQLQAIRQQCKDNWLYINGSIGPFLCNWLTHHITLYDHKMAEFLLKK